MARFAVGVFLCLLVSTFLVAQDTDPASGILPFSTQAVGTYDSVDIATGNRSLGSQPSLLSIKRGEEA